VFVTAAAGLECCLWRLARQEYSNLTVFKMAGVRHLGFFKLKFITVAAVKNSILHHRTEFRKDRSNRCGDRPIAIFVIFKMAATAILDLLGAYSNHPR